MFVEQNSKISLNAEKYLFSPIDGRHSRAIPFNRLLNFARAAWFTKGLFCFGYLLDSGANDPRLFGAQECELKEAAGETRAKETVPVARERRSTDGAIRVGGIAAVCFLRVGRKLFFLRSILKEKYVRELPNQRDRYLDSL